MYSFHRERVQKGHEKILSEYPVEVIDPPIGGARVRRSEEM